MVAVFSLTFSLIQLFCCFSVCQSENTCLQNIYAAAVCHPSLCFPGGSLYFFSTPYLWVRRYSIYMTGSINNLKCHPPRLRLHAGECGVTVRRFPRKWCAFKTQNNSVRWTGSLCQFGMCSYQSRHHFMLLMVSHKSHRRRQTPCQ